MSVNRKYDILTRYLENCGKESITLSFDQISDIVGGLKPFAYKYSNAWSNTSGAIYYAWINAGYIAHAQMQEQRVTFTKGDPTRKESSRQKRCYTVKKHEPTLDIELAISSIRKYYHTTTDGVHTRYRSWEHCNKAFREFHDQPDKAEYLCLQLACYLASWGMLRNSFLLNKDYFVHVPIVNAVISGRYDALFSDDQNADLIPLVMEISDMIFRAYGDAHVTDTLATKILLGIFGCAPAYDRFFKFSARKYHVCGGTWSARSLTSLWNYYELHKKQFEELRNELQAGGICYPPMKLMDMCLWQIGFDEDGGNEIGSNASEE